MYCGRGRVNYDKPGTKFWRKLIEDNLERYEEETDKKKKHLIASGIVNQVRNQNPPGRFLTKFEGKWTILHTDEAIKKCKEAFANAAHRMRNNDGGGIAGIAGEDSSDHEFDLLMAEIEFAISEMDTNELEATVNSVILNSVEKVSLNHFGGEGNPEEELEAQYEKFISDKMVKEAVKALFRAQTKKRQKLDEVFAKEEQKDKPVAGGAGGLSKMTPVDSQYVAPDFEMVSVMANVEIVKDELLEEGKEYTGPVLLGKAHGSGCMKYIDKEGNYTGKVICGNWYV